jgi:putative membrane protein
MTKRIEKIFMLLVPLAYLVGIVLHLAPHTRPGMLAGTSGVLYLGALLVLVFVFLEPRRDLAIWAAVLYASILLIEMAGVAWGIPFGRFEYGQLLGFKLLGVPPVIGLNWLVLVLGLAMTARRLTSRRWLCALLAGVMAVFLNYFMEPVAMSLEYWVWKEEYAPLQNFAAWFLIAAAGSYWLPEPAPESRLPLVYAACQFFFFCFIYLFLR